MSKLYLDIERIKASAKDEFCIVTLKRNKIYDFYNVKNISPLCLPENPSEVFEGKTATVLGFAYTKDFQVLAKTRNDNKKMISRLIISKGFNFKSTRNCYSEIHVLRNEVFLKYVTDDDISTACNYAMGWSGLLI